MIATMGALGVSAMLLTACGNEPGSVADDPLAVKLVDAETKMQDWPGVEMTMTFTGSGQLGGRSLPCMSITSKSKPESFSMDFIRLNDGGAGTCSGSEDQTVRMQYADDVIYVTDLGGSSYGGDGSCEVTSESHQVSGELAQEFIDQQTKQAKMSDMMQAATDISGDDHTINITLDTETMMELGDSAVPSDADPDDIDVTAVADLDDDGALKSLEISISAGDAGALDIGVTYAKSSTTPKMPSGKCVESGEAYTSTSQLQSALT